MINVEKRKLLFIMDNMDSGGSQNVLKFIINSLKNEFDIELLLINRYGVYLNEINSDIKIISIFSELKQTPLKKLMKMNIIKRIKGIILKSIFRSFFYMTYISFMANYKLRNKSYDYIIGFQEGPSNFLAYKINKTCHKIGWIHSNINKMNKFQSKLEKNVYENLDKIIFVSKFIMEEAFSKYKFDKNKCLTLNNPVNINKILKLSKERIESFDKNEINFLSIGRLSPEKNYSQLIESFSKISDTNKKLYILGDGPLREELQQKIDMLNRNHTIRLLGFDKNPYKYLLNCDYYISASDYEGLPTTVIEALILKKIIIASNLEVNKWLLKDEKKYYIFDSFEKFEWIISNIEDKRKYSSNFDINKFSIESFKEKIEHIFKEVERN